MKRKSAELEEEYPAWMLQNSKNPGLSNQLNERAYQAHAGSDVITSPSVDLGDVTYKDASDNEHTKKVYMIHAVDSILTDGDRVLTIQRKGPPDQDKLAFVGGLVDPKEESMGPIDIRETASNELAEEANGIISKDRGEVIGERKIVREPRDIRVVSGIPAHFKNVEKYGVQPGDLMLVTTQAVLFKVTPEELDIMQRDFYAGSDARKGSARLNNITDLLRDKSMGLDHGLLLEEANAHMQQEKMSQVSKDAPSAVERLRLSRGSRGARESIKPSDSYVSKAAGRETGKGFDRS